MTDSAKPMTGLADWLRMLFVNKILYGVDREQVSRWAAEVEAARALMREAADLLNAFPGTGDYHGLPKWVAQVNDMRKRLHEAAPAAPGAAVPAEQTDAELIEAFIAHNSQFLRSSDHPQWLSCKDGDGNWTSLRGDLFAASLRHLIESTK